MADLLETATQAGSFTQLLSALEAANLNDTLKNPGPITVLAPTDEAFAKLPEGTIDGLLKEPLKLKRLLTYHVISGDVRSDDLAQIDEAPTMEGSIVAVEHENGLKVNDANVLKTDILADNGVIHVIDTVLMPTLAMVE
uniref:fasciclin domain-containing protein n=1 Tax=Trichocoleus desertorum TaxID=1481672 RepID=UPI0025B617E5|nr:fasciclin domain-containing protein [Trichocoleus desertorum]